VSSRRRHTRCYRDWSSDVCSSDLIEHRLFSFITQNWRGQPLVSHAVIVNLIAATTTTTGLRVRARLDTARYPSGLKVSRDALDAVRLRPDAFHGDWNYTILPTSSAKR